MILKREESERMAAVLHELGLSYEEAVKVMCGVTKDAQLVEHLWGKPNAVQEKSRLVKLGLALITFPVPMMGIKKTLGTILITAALIKERRSSIRVVDTYNTFRDVTRELQKTWESDY